MRPRQAQFVMLMLFAAACQPAENSDEADVAAIRAMTEAWEAAVQAEDVPALVAMCTDDIVVWDQTCRALEASRCSRSPIAVCLKPSPSRPRGRGRRDRGDRGSG